MLIQMQVTQNLREDLKNLKVRVIFVTEIKRSKKKLFFNMPQIRGHLFFSVVNDKIFRKQIPFSVHS